MPDAEQDPTRAYQHLCGESAPNMRVVWIAVLTCPVDNVLAPCWLCAMDLKSQTGSKGGALYVYIGRRGTFQ